MATITDQYMQEMLGKTKTYCACIIKATPKRQEQGADQVVWEHGRRNFSLRPDGLLSIVCPIADGSGVSGLYIFNAGVDQVKQIMDEDPAVKAAIFTYELHACLGFPGDKLPE